MKISGKELRNAVKASLKKAPYWNYVQDEVKSKIEVIADNFEQLGPTFKDAFMSTFKHEHASRVISGQNTPASVPGVLFGEEMSEECYQSGKSPVKHLLHLDDWFLPNEADVQICIALCHHVEHLEKLLQSKSITDLLSESNQNPEQN